MYYTKYFVYEIDTLPVYIDTYRFATMGIPKEKAAGKVPHIAQILTEKLGIHRILKDDAVAPTTRRANAPDKVANLDARKTARKGSAEVANP